MGGSRLLRRWSTIKADSHLIHDVVQHSKEACSIAKITTNSSATKAVSTCNGQEKSPRNSPSQFLNTAPQAKTCKEPSAIFDYKRKQIFNFNIRINDLTNFMYVFIFLIFSHSFLCKRELRLDPDPAFKLRPCSLYMGSNGLGSFISRVAFRHPLKFLIKLIFC